MPIVDVQDTYRATTVHVPYLLPMQPYIDMGSVSVPRRRLQAGDDACSRLRNRVGDSDRCWHSHSDPPSPPSPPPRFGRSQTGAPMLDGTRPAPIFYLNTPDLYKDDRDSCLTPANLDALQASKQYVCGGLRGAGGYGRPFSSRFQPLTGDRNERL